MACAPLCAQRLHSCVAVPVCQQAAGACASGCACAGGNAQRCVCKQSVAPSGAWEEHTPPLRAQADADAVADGDVTVDKPPRACRTQTDRRGRRRRRRGNGGGRHEGSWDREEDGAADRTGEEPCDVEVPPLRHPEGNEFHHPAAFNALAEAAKGRRLRGDVAAPTRVVVHAVEDRDQGGRDPHRFAQRDCRKSELSPRLAPSSTIATSTGICATREKHFRQDYDSPTRFNLHTFGEPCFVVLQKSERAIYMFNGQYNTFSRLFADAPQAHVLLRSRNRLQIHGPCCLSIHQTLFR